MCIFLQSKWLEGEDPNAENCSRVGDNKTAMQSWEGQNRKKEVAAWKFGMKADVEGDE